MYYDRGEELQPSIVTDNQIELNNRHFSQLKIRKIPCKMSTLGY